MESMPQLCAGERLPWPTLFPRLLSSREPGPPRHELEAHNAQQAVNQIPSELLVYIFQMVQDAVYSGCWGMVPFTIEWIPLTWVCRHWRNVSLTAPILWSTIHVTSYFPSTTSTIRLTTFLDRAAGASLNISFVLMAT
ncbi:hypothetical protein C8Q76DRAFT_753373 [Earliella scabrosa]|nr:hypothetical protein C8Q76DRAFT_753373 [Earliella scabrosa]